MVLPRGLAEAGHLLEHRIAPPFYRRSRIVTLSQSSKAEIVDRLHLPAEQITVTPPGRRAALHPRAANARPRRSWWRSAAWCRSSGSTCSSRRWCGSRRTIPTCGPSSPARATSGPRSRPCSGAHGAEDWIELPGLRRRRRPRRPLPVGVGGRLVVAARGLGHDGHRGRAPAARRRWPPGSAATRTPSSTAGPGCWWTRPTSWSPRLDAVLRDEVLRRRLGTGPWSTPPGSRGTPPPGARWPRLGAEALSAPD